jgi:phosphoenolpyruvate carboxykinase (GTP)
MEIQKVENTVDFLRKKLDSQSLERLLAVRNPRLHAFVADAVRLTMPKSVFVCANDEEDLVYIRELAKNGGGEFPLATQGHTYHFDGYQDQARDKAKTKYLLPEGADLGESLNSTDKKTGTEEVRSFLAGSMAGKQMLICFFCLGPTNSEFSISCVQITDSPYVGHSEIILYRPGYEQFKKLKPDDEFFKFIHTEGELENGVSKNVDKRRIYIDLQDNIVYSTNTQYAGNTVGLKKLALRLAINKASKEGWLAEHMFVMGVHGPNNRVTYFTGAFPSACGKTSTSMLPGQTIIGDDIAYLRKIDGEVRCVNVERGIFGIIRDVNVKDDPIIYEAITKPGEVIFGNVLITDDLMPHWLGMGKELPNEGTNHSGKWFKGKIDDQGNEITASHKNARYTVSISSLFNKDPEMDNPKGVHLGAIIYGGRDSDTLVPVEQAFSWTEGIIAKGAAIESETTAAALGKEGVRTFNIMSNMDFVAVPLGRYIQNNLDFANDIQNPPAIFSVNYFLRDENGKYLNEILDKMVWILWAELRANGDVDAIKTPTGFIPLHKDLEKLFAEKLHTEYTEEAYVREFTIRIPKLIAKFERVENIYRTKVLDTPQIVYDTFAQIKQRLNQTKEKLGDFISPLRLLKG